MKKNIKYTFMLLLCGLSFATSTAYAKSKKTNIVVIFGDDIGQDNISAYHRGLLGNRTPNIDRIAQEGAIFTDAYAQQVARHIFLVKIHSVQAY